MKEELLENRMLHLLLDNKSFFKNKQQTDIYWLTNLIQYQKKLKEPIFLIPHFLALWNKPPRLKPTPADLIFGTTKHPGRLRMLLRLMLHHRNSRWEILEPLNLLEWLNQTQQGQESSHALAQKLKTHLLKPLNRLEEALYGPPIKSFSQLEQDILRDRNLATTIDSLAEQTGLPKSKLINKTTQTYRNMASRIDVDFLRVFKIFFQLFWFRIYNGLHWNRADIERIRQKSLKGPLIFLPSHRSHADYIAVSYVLYEEGFLPPLIAAGENLSFFPMGFLFRRGGAFFIRRSFKGDPLYTQTVKAYLRQILKEGFSQEFFIEGKRSRTGKTLPPKLGLLSMLVDCLLEGKPEDAVFCPLSISYEKLVEDNSYLSELGGQEKQEENASQLFRSFGIFNKHHGNVYLNFEKPFTFKEFLQAHSIEPQAMTPHEKKEVVQKLAYQIVDGINKSSLITSTALVAAALFGTSKRCLPFHRLLLYTETILRRIQLVSNSTTHISEDLKNDLKSSVFKSIDMLLKDRLLHKETLSGVDYFRIKEKAGLLFESYKNNLMYYFAFDAILATAWIGLGGTRGQQVQRSALFQLTHQLLFIFQFEFIYPTDKKLIDLFDHHLHLATEHHILEKENQTYSIVQNQTAYLQIQFTSRLIKNFVDCYWICAQKLEQLTAQKHSKKSLTAALLDKVRSAYLNGTIDYPEAANKAMIEHFVLLMSHNHILLLLEDGKATLAKDYKIRLSPIIYALQKAKSREFV